MVSKPYEPYAELRREIERIGELPDKVRDEVAERLLFYWMDIEAPLYHCESPIEMLMFLALDQCREFCERELARSNTRLCIQTQSEIEAGGKLYRVDFEVYVCDPRDSNCALGPRMVIECDGHEFHEKTKEQAARDKRRDRHLQMAGYTVFRFTGSEIWENATGCAAQALGHLFRASGIEGAALILKPLERRD